ncbi:50S ribosomal protein L21 [Fastidiosipila sanguinis]|uniref:Large ribosomal subunit protein bL21 n=1 Tax=Fastidiosipila sanguinis TaxID=236753 RepID=A0A2S0KLH0_9FIRM|nr:50S ribosomal protein L21 [Fastidiosipila sanguinis]AVM41885.1 50S ribosomal protein L21 [Fastidiosipila sanguinis]
MYAVIRSGGKQYRVEEGQVVYLEKLEGEVGDTVELETLAVADDAGIKFGEVASVKAEIVKHGRGKKIRVFKYKPKKRYRRTQGHRQAYTSVRITSI